MNHFIFALVGLGMAFLIGYAFWIKIRLLWLKTDILSLAADLRESAIILGRTDDLAYKQTLELTTNTVVSFCSMISLPTMVYLGLVTSNRETDWPKSDNPDMQAAIDRCQNGVGSRIARYVLLETGLGLLTMLLMFGLVSVFAPSRMIWKAVQDATVHASSAFRRPFFRSC